MTGNASTRAVGMSGANEAKSPTPMGGASVSEVLAAADPFEPVRFGGSPRTVIAAASPCIDGTTRPQNRNERAASASDQAKSSHSEQPTQMRFSLGDGSSTTAASKASTARSFATRDRTSRRSLSDRLTQSLITSGLVCGITPMSIRQLSGQPIRVLAFDTPVGGDVGSPSAAFSFSTALRQAARQASNPTAEGV